MGGETQAGTDAPSSLGCPKPVCQAYGGSDGRKVGPAPEGSSRYGERRPGQGADARNSGKISMMFTAESEMAMSEEEFRLIREIIHSHCGLSFDYDTKYLLEKRLARRLMHLRMESFREYYHFLKYNRGR